jgi:hypothetical protein
MTAMDYSWALPPKKATTASTTRPRTCPCGTGRRLDDESCVKTGSVMRATRVRGIRAAAIGLAAPASTGTSPISFTGRRLRVVRRRRIAGHDGMGATL